MIHDLSLLQDKLAEMQSSLAGLKKENGALREQVKAKQVPFYPVLPTMEGAVPLPRLRM